MKARKIKQVACAAVLGIAFHAHHEAQLPPCRREEHAVEGEPARATDFGINVNYAAATTVGTMQTMQNIYYGNNGSSGSPISFS